MENKKIEKFKTLIEKKPSSFLEKFEAASKNRQWLDKSAQIAILLLEILRERGWTQKKLASEMDVSAQQVNKIVKGQENLTLETICKIEKVLGFSLIETVDYSIVKNIKTNSTKLLPKSNNLILEIATKASLSNSKYKRKVALKRTDIVCSNPIYNKSYYSNKQKEAA